MMFWTFLKLQPSATANQRGKFMINGLLMPGVIILTAALRQVFHFKHCGYRGWFVSAQLKLTISNPSGF
jgi:hypothetical protein